jgi:hypothetical protein
MSRPLRAFLLILVVLLEGLGSSAWAMPPKRAAAAAAAAEMAMPCHRDAAHPPSAALPCCDDDDCHCDANCLGATSALAPLAAGVALPARQTLDAAALTATPRTVHLNAPFRPPAAFAKS